MQRPLLGRVAVVGLPLVVLLLFLALEKSESGFSGALDAFQALLALILGFVIPGVVFLLVRAYLRWALAGGKSLRIFSEIPLKYSLSVRKLGPAPTRLDMPNFGMYCGWILMVPMIIFMILQTPRIPTGLAVRVPSPYATALPRAPESESLGVYVGKGGQFYVNGQLVPREQLRARLQDELSRKILWIVYFEADDDVAYGQVVYAIDTIRSLGAQAYWVTPRVREEFGRAPGPANRRTTR